MELLEIFVDSEDNERLDLYLSQEMNDVSRSYIQKLIKEGLVKVNNKAVKAKYIVSEGDYIQVHLPEPKKLEIESENIAIDVVYEDEDIAVVNKPQGMVVHPAPGNYSGTLVNALLYHLNSLSSINGIIRPGIVHRIDKDTSGLLMIAKNNLAHEELSKQLKAHTINRIYYALVDGNIKEEKGTVDAPIGRHPVDRKKMTVISLNSREAVTHFKVLERFGQYTLIEAKLETGRTHQIRVHMSFISHPVTGDPLYGGKNQRFRTSGQLLHAKTIGFIHPRTKKYLEFDSPLPEHFTRILNILRG